MTKYIIESGHDCELLAKRIEARLSKGYVLFGSMQMASVGLSVRYAQALTLEIDN